MVLACGAWVLWVQETRSALRSADAPPLEFAVPVGTSVEAIGQRLHAHGYVRHPLILKLLVASRGSGARLKAGEYTLAGPLSLVEIVELFERGEDKSRELTFPEGKNLEELAAIAAGHGLDAVEFLAAAREPTPILDLDPQAKDLEGYLFPDTYDVPLRQATSRALVARMLQRFREVLASEREALAKSGLSLRQAATVASLVELETARGDERPRIAAVFLNRLKRGMLLQTDPTVIYALKRQGRWNGNIRKADLQIDSPYNTYRYAGLPPGPIASFGRAALQAVLQPAVDDALYFVSRNDGSHEFNSRLRDHERAVDRYQRQPRRSRG